MPGRRRSAAALSATALLWLIATAELWRLATAPGRLPASPHTLFYFTTLGFLTYFWLFSAQHLITFVVWALTRKSGSSREEASAALQAMDTIVIAYTCFNDFIEECAKSCLAVRYFSASVFICDDSTDASVRAEIDRFCHEHEQACTLVRRTERRAFKAGNLNGLLRHLRDINLNAAYLLLVDNDSLIDPDFPRQAVAMLERHPELAFVQAPHRAYLPANATSFQHALSMGVQAMWRFLALKNRFGMVPLLGHGALLRMSALRQAGGFPPRVSEDLVLSTKLREIGYYGHVLESVWCSEGLPPTFSQYRRRVEKWAIGAIEFLRRDAIGVLCSRMSNVERVDLGMSILNILNAIPIFGLLVIASVVWPLVLGVARPTTLVVGGVDVATNFPGITLDLGTTVSTSGELGWLICVASLASLVQFGPDFVRAPLRSLAHVSSTFLCFCGILVPCCVSGVVVLLTGRYQFRGTGDGCETRTWRRGTKGLAQNFFVGRWGSLCLEVVCGVGACFVAFITHNMFLGSVALGILFSPVLDLLGWDFCLVRPFRHVPFALFFAQMASMTLPGWAAGAITSSLILIHF